MVKGLILPSLIAFTMLQAAETKTLTTNVVTAISISNIYVSILGRSPTKEGLDYWAKSGLSNSDIASSFFEQPETEDTFPRGLSPEDLIQNTYKNLFGRNVDDAGFTYWHEQFISVESYSMSKFIMSISNGAIGDDAKIVNNRNSVALAFAKSGNKDIRKAKEIVEETTASDASVINVIQKYSLQKTYIQITESYQLQVEKDAKLAIADPAKAAADEAAKKAAAVKVKADEAAAAAAAADEAAKKAATEAAAAAKVKADEAAAAAAAAAAVVVVAAPSGPVADTTVPVITLLGDASVTLTVGETYTDAGATATDNVDGNLTSTIVIAGNTVDTATVATYTINYNVHDAANNAATEVTRTVIVQAPADTEAPVITLLGSLSITLEYGETYTDAGATATDNIDGNLTSSISKGGDTVNTTSAQTYNITYNVNDAAGNAATQVTRTVTVNQLPLPVLPSVSAQTYFVNSLITPLIIGNTGGAHISGCASTPTLPNGITLNDSNATNCILSGTPDANSTATDYNITATNPTGDASTTINITVNVPSATNLQTPADQNLTVDIAMSTINIENIGGAISSCASNPILPNGLSIDSATCAISGTPNTLQSATDYNITAIGTDGNSSTTLSIEVHAAPPVVQLPVLGTASGDINVTVNTAITPITFTNSGGAIASCAVSPALPTGLDVNATTCEITGTPTAVLASADYIVTATNSAGDANSTVNITVNAAAAGSENNVTTADLNTRLKTLFGITGTTIESNLTDANNTAKVVFTGFVDTNTTYAYHIVGWDSDNDNEHNTTDNNGTLSAFVSTSLGNQVKYLSNKDENITDSFQFFISDNTLDVNSSNFTVEINATVIAVAEETPSDDGIDINTTVLNTKIATFETNATAEAHMNEQNLTLGDDNSSYTYHIIDENGNIWNGSDEFNTTDDNVSLLEFDSTTGQVKFVSNVNADVNSTFRYFISADVNGTDVNSTAVDFNITSVSYTVITQADLNTTIISMRGADANNSLVIDANITNSGTIYLNGNDSNDTNGSYTYHIVGWDNASDEHNTTDNNGTLSDFNSTAGSVVYISNKDENITDSFQFFISDNTLDVNSSNFTVEINATVIAVAEETPSDDGIDINTTVLNTKIATFETNATAEAHMNEQNLTLGDGNSSYTYHIIYENNATWDGSDEFNTTDDNVSLLEFDSTTGQVKFVSNVNADVNSTFRYFISADVNGTDVNSTAVDFNITSVSYTVITQADLNTTIISMRGADANNSLVIDANITNSGTIYLNGNDSNDTNGSYTYHIMSADGTSIWDGLDEFNTTDNNGTVSDFNSTAGAFTYTAHKDNNDTISYFISSTDSDANSSIFTFDINATYVAPVYLTTADLNATIRAMRSLGVDSNGSDVNENNISLDDTTQTIYLSGTDNNDTNASYEYHIVNIDTSNYFIDYNNSTSVQLDSNSSNGWTQVYTYSTDSNHTVTIEYYIQATDNGGATSGHFQFDMNATK